MINIYKSSAAAAKEYGLEGNLVAGANICLLYTSYFLFEKISGMIRRDYKFYFIHFFILSFSVKMVYIFSDLFVIRKLSDYSLSLIHILASLRFTERMTSTSMPT